MDEAITFHLEGKLDIIIVGCGRVGYIIAEQLSKEKHNVTLIDNKQHKLAPALANLDVQAVVGNGTTFGTLKEAGIKSAELLIAVTGEDEINMVSCMVAKKANSKCQTIARIRKPEYLPERNYFKNALDISMIINPELAAAREINQLINIPDAIEMDSFARGRLELLRVNVTGDSILNGMTVANVSKRFDRKVLICILVHGDEITIPNGDAMLSEGDSISIILPKEYIPTFYNAVSNSGLNSIKNVMIAGGGTTAFYLAELLIDSGINVKIIEEDRARCDELCESLPKAEIINGDAEDRSILNQSGLIDMDAFVAATTIDEENIFLSLYANKVSPKCKLITRIQKLQRDDIITSLPIGSIITPRRLTAEYILQFVRASRNSKSSSMDALYSLMDGRVEALEFSIRNECSVLNTPLQELNLRTNLLVCAIVRGKRLITPSGRDELKLGDNVVVVTTDPGLKDITDILESAR